MCEFFAMIGEAIINFIHRFIYSARAYNELASTRRELANLVDRKDAAIADLHIEIEDLKKSLETEHKQLLELQATVEEKDGLILNQKRKIDQHEEYKRVDAEYLRNVQKQLAEEFALHPVFGFPRSLGLPGSVSIVSSRTADSPDDLGFTVTRGRIILDDTTTKYINSTPHMYEKLSHILNFMRRYGSMTKIIEDLIVNGAMSMTLAYREETTTYEMFYEVTGKNYALDSVLVFDSDTGCKVDRKEGEG